MTRDVERAREVGQSLSVEQVSRYAPMLAAYQRIHAAELRALIGALPLYPGDRVLEAACGEGMYSIWLADRVAPGGAVVGLDRDPVALAQARSNANASGLGKLISFKQGDVGALPFDGNTFDLIWCDQSRLSTADWEIGLRELRRVTRPAGYVAMLAHDTINQIGLPWPPALQSAIRQAQVEAFQESSPDAGSPDEVDLCGSLTNAGLEECTVTSYTTTHYVPFSLNEYTYLANYLETLRHDIVPFLSHEHQEWLDQLCAPQSETYLLNGPNVSVTYVDMVVCARKR